MLPPISMNFIIMSFIQKIRRPAKKVFTAITCGSSAAKPKPESILFSPCQLVLISNSPYAIPNIAGEMTSMNLNFSIVSGERATLCIIPKIGDTNVVRASLKRNLMISSTISPIVLAAFQIVSVDVMLNCSENKSCAVD
jgi:hypothetical protein